MLSRAQAARAEAEGFDVSGLQVLAFWDHVAWHCDDWCPLVSGTASPQFVSGFRSPDPVCSRCASAESWQVMLPDRVSGAAALDFVRAEGVLAHAPVTASPYALVRHLTYLRAARDVVASYPDSHESTPWRDRLLEQFPEQLGVFVAALASERPRVLAWAAAELVCAEPPLAALPGSLPGALEATLLPGSPPRSPLVPVVTGAWRRTLRPDGLDRRVHADSGARSLLGELRSRAPSFPAPSFPGLSGDLLAAFDVFDARLAELLALPDDGSFLVAAMHDPVDLPCLAVLRVSSPERVFRSGPLVAAWVRSRRDLSAVQAAELPPGASPRVVETAVGLFDPFGDGPLADLGQALQAASALVSDPGL